MIICLKNNHKNNMKILSIDTASKICSVAVLENNNLIDKIDIDNGLTHSEKLMPMIDEILKKHNLHLKDINLIVCDKGPGSFTGIRIGVATVKSFKDSLDIPVIGISSLESLVYNEKADGLICSLIDARNLNCYFALYNLDNGIYTQIENFNVDTVQNIFSLLSKYETQITFVGDGSVNYKNEILERFSNALFSNSNDLDSYSLGLAGLNHFKLEDAIEDILPMYLRKSQAERMLEEKNANK